MMTILIADGQTIAVAGVLPAVVARHHAATSADGIAGMVLGPGRLRAEDQHGEENCEPDDHFDPECLRQRLRHLIMTSQRRFLLGRYGKA